MPSSPIRPHPPSGGSDAGSESLAPDQPGLKETSDSLADYKLELVIGRGSFGKVFKVSLNSTGQVFALKVMHKSRVISAKQAHYLLEERDAMAKMRHPFVLGMQRAFQTATKLYMVLDYAPGGDLRYRLSRMGGSFSESIIRFVASEVFLALEFLLRVKVMHRDLKSENVLLDSSGHLLLADFGLAKASKSTELPRSRSFVGTPDYLAPEIVNKEDYGPQVDWWAFGILIYEMLTGDTPFSGLSPDAIYLRIRHESPHIPSTASPPVRELIQTLLCRDPVNRPGSTLESIAPVKSCQFFKKVQWDKIFARRVASPLRSHVDELDLRNFDPELVVLEQPVDSMAEPADESDPQAEELNSLFDWVPEIDAS